MHWLSPDRKLCPPVDHVQRLQLAPSVHDAHLTQVASNIAVSQIECQMYPGEMFIHDVRLGKTPFILAPIPPRGTPLSLRPVALSLEGCTVASFPRPPCFSRSVQHTVCMSSWHAGT